jgi:hypothetical protein
VRDEKHVMCGDCPPVGYPTDKTRCEPCPRRSVAAENVEPTEYVIPARILHVVYNTLQFFGNHTSYRGRRTGGVLKGCPREPDPTPEQMSVHARLALRILEREILKRKPDELTPE